MVSLQTKLWDERGTDAAQASFTVTTMVEVRDSRPLGFCVSLYRCVCQGVDYDEVWEDDADGAVPALAGHVQGETDVPEPMSAYYTIYSAACLSLTTPFCHRPANSFLYVRAPPVFST